MNTQPGQRLNYIASLDSFRFFAVLLVIFSHWLPATVINRFPNGFTGVTFFFVLSGFLISSNLLIQKKAIETGKTGLGTALKVFYIRRTLRIFPLYYLVILLLLWLAPAMYEGNIWWFVAYVPNFLIFKTKAWPGMLSHFWSLGVEEQFYLIWPLLIFLTPRSKLKWLFPGLILFSIIFKIFLFSWQNPFFNFYDALPFSCFDAFGVGAMLALITVDTASAGRLGKITIPASLGFLAAVVLCFIIYLSGVSFLFGLAVSLASYFAIQQAINGYHGIPGFIVNNSFLQYLGKISYGLYVYHNFVPWILRCITGRETRYPLFGMGLNIQGLRGGIGLFVLHFILLVIIASLSWWLIENPINKLKRKFA